MTKYNNSYIYEISIPLILLSFFVLSIKHNIATAESFDISFPPCLTINNIKFLKKEYLKGLIWFFLLILEFLNLKKFITEVNVPFSNGYRENRKFIDYVTERNTKEYGLAAYGAQLGCFNPSIFRKKIRPGTHINHPRSQRSPEPCFEISYLMHIKCVFSGIFRIFFSKISIFAFASLMGMLSICSLLGLF